MLYISSVIDWKVQHWHVPIVGLKDCARVAGIDSGQSWQSIGHSSIETTMLASHKIANNTLRYKLKQWMILLAFTVEETATAWKLRRSQRNVRMSC